MSYDLLIFPKAFDAKAIRAHFSDRANYTFSGTQAFYSNDDTGVYFTFDVVEHPERDEEDESPSGPHLALNLNYFRPHVFGLEAEPEIAALLQRFECSIHDPQLEGMGEAPYSREGFLKGWNEGNRFGFQAMSARTTAPPPWPADPTLIEAIWRWNIGRPARQKEAGDNLFVARISWFQLTPDTKPVATSIWTEGVPTMLPHSLITHVALVRKPRVSLGRVAGLLAGKARPGLELKLSGVEGIARGPGVETGMAGDVQTLLTPATGPRDTGAFSGAWPNGEAKVIAAENVCGADLIALMKKL